MTKEDFMKRMDHCFISKKEYKRNIKKLFEIGVLDEETISKMEDNFLPIYPIAGAIYEKEAGWYLTGSCDDSTRRKARRQCNYYKSFL